MVWWNDTEALREVGLRALQAGDPAGAFACADRLCRIGASPTASDWLARSVVHHRLGRLHDFRTDLDQAMLTGWCEPTILRSALALHPDRATRLDACRSLIASQRASQDDLRFAMAILLELGGSVARRILRTISGLQGWVACRTGSRPEISFKTAAHTGTVVPRAPMDHDFGPAWQIRPVAIPLDPDRPAELAIHLDGHLVETWTDIPRTLTTSPVRRTSAKAVINADVVVIVPIYGDAPTLASCLAGLRNPAASLDVHIVVVDDCSPDEDVTTLGRDFCRATGGTFLRLPVNAGFAAAVNAALERVSSADVLILNSDVVLPDGAVDRLHRAARCEARIGTVAPLSNDAGGSSFPAPFTRNPLPSQDEAIAIDRVAARVNDGLVVDVVANLGSCLYLTDRCRRDVGLFSHAYGRGYYEDVDFCLKAREAGYRNVVAPDVYVSHASSRSFGTAKRQLATENRIVIETRFPRFDDAEAAFMRADPLAGSRAAIEEALMGPGQPSVVVAAPGGQDADVLEERCAALGGEYRVILAHWSRGSVGSAVTLRGFGGEAPQSLRFELTRDGQTRLQSYLTRQDVRWFEIAGVKELPDDVTSCFEAVAPCRWLIAGPEDARRIEPRQPARPVWSVFPGDSMAAASLGVPYPGRDRVADGGARPSRTEPGLGILMPDACARSERFVVSLARRIRRTSHLNLVILGACLDETQLMSVGNVWVHGAIEADALAAVARKTGVQALLSPYRDGHFGLLDRTATEADVPKAFFDWSASRLAAAARDLALPVDLDDQEATDRLLSWCTKIAVPERKKAV